MKNILCFGDSNTWGAKPLLEFGKVFRYPHEARWTTTLQSNLGSEYQVIIEGLVARTTAFDDEIEGRHKNGERHFHISLETHMPLDLVIIMLGTNDVKSRFGKSSWDIAGGAGRLLDLLNNPPKPLLGGTPKQLLIAPPPLGQLSFLADTFAGGLEKSKGLGAAYKRMAELKGCDFLNAGDYIQTSDVDGVHFDEDQLTPLAQAVTDKVTAMFA